MKKPLKIAVVLVLVGIALQFVPRTENYSEIVPDTDLLKAYDATPEITAIFKKACYDCHSNTTEYLWYHNIQPLRFLIDQHVKEGKEVLDLSEFKNYSNRRQKSKLKSIISQVKQDKMPLKSYTLLHGDAKLSSLEKETLIRWTENILDNY
ncbi:MAG: hypothetical protein COB81_03280 [Flavobacteriaceae bacterium]|nr:MAG: hypothetical protein COB81_03280 [Flavobacteriaceae bacterium]